ncbi:fibronectin type III domain-containing protein [Pseudolysinimonas yzui]|nr:fibronectin type III domain-containing protein [Pseudolysinimonas yzui]
MTRRAALTARASAAVVLGVAVSLAPVGVAAAPDPDVFFPSDPATLAIFEFNGDVLDSSGNGRHATLLDPSATYVASTYGQGLVLPRIDDQAQGIDWSAYASLLTPPYTVEVLVHPTDIDSWKRLFTHDNLDDNGLYYFDGGLQNYPDAPLAGVSLPADTLHCLAWSAPETPVNTLDLYLDGDYLGQVGRSYAVPTQAWFFMDDLSVPNENILGHVDAMRISNVARTGTELADACAASNTGTPLTTVPGPPTALTADPASGEAVLAWVTPASDGGSPITDYVVEYSSDGGTTWSIFADGVSTATTARVTGLVAGQAYLFRVSAVNAVGAGPTVATTSGVTLAALLPPTGETPGLLGGAALALLLAGAVALRLARRRASAPSVG